LLSQDWQIKNFDKVGNSPTSWLSCADDLLAACHFLSKHSATLNHDWGTIGGSPPDMDEVRIFGVIKMLRGMAVECLLKALWLKSGGELARDGVYIQIPGTEKNPHNLVKLAAKVATRVSLTLTVAERDLLKRLSLSIFGGRYPVPRNWQHTKIQPLFNGGKGLPCGWLIPSDEKLFASLLNRLKTMINL
jgi:hypothetical protein